MSTISVTTAKKTAIDIHKDCIRSWDGQASGSGGPKDVNCDDLLDLGLVDNDVNTQIKGEVANVRNGDDSQVAWVKPDKDVTAWDLLVTGMKLGSTWGCTESGGDYLCVRVMGGLVSTARIHVALAEDEESRR